MSTDAKQLNDLETDEFDAVLERKIIVEITISEYMWRAFTKACELDAIKNPTNANHPDRFKDRHELYCSYAFGALDHHIGRLAESASEHEMLISHGLDDTWQNIKNEKKSEPK